jgi:trehalose-6-phosphatase
MDKFFEKWDNPPQKKNLHSHIVTKEIELVIKSFPHNPHFQIFMSNDFTGEFYQTFKQLRKSNSIKVLPEN